MTEDKVHNPLFDDSSPSSSEVSSMTSSSPVPPPAHGYAFNPWPQRHQVIPQVSPVFHVQPPPPAHMGGRFPSPPPPVVNAGWIPGGSPFFRGPFISAGIPYGAAPPGPLPNPFMAPFHASDPMYNDIGWLRYMAVQAETALDVFRKRISQLEQLHIHQASTLGTQGSLFQPVGGQVEMRYLPHQRFQAPLFQPSMPPPNFQQRNEPISQAAERRFVPNADQVFLLENAYQSCPELDQRGFASLGAIMSTTESQIRLWMAKRRAVDKKEQDNSLKQQNTE